MRDNEQSRRANRPIGIPIAAGVAVGTAAGLLVAGVARYFMRDSSDPAQELLERIVRAADRLRST
jgi:hypothetical protein